MLFGLEPSRATTVDIPYFDGCRVDAVYPAGRDSVICFIDGSGRLREFASVADYLEFYKRSGREL